MKYVFRFLFRAVTLVLIVILMLVLVACLLINSNSKYHGEHKALYTVAVNNIFDAAGHVSNGELIYDPTITVLETDDFGRTLFCYDETDLGYSYYSVAFVIAQRVEDNYVYYYQDTCYEPYMFEQDFDHDGKAEHTLNAALSRSQDAIETLKERNDWNREMREEKCTKTEISVKKPKGELKVKTYTLDEPIYTYAKQNGYEGTDESLCRYVLFCNADTAGKELYRVSASAADDDGKGGTVYTYFRYAVIVERVDGKIVVREGAIAELSDPRDDVETVKQLKEANGWQYPSEGDQ